MDIKTLRDEIFSSQDPETESLQEKETQFDVVVSSEVIEHVNNVESFLSDCSDCVKHGGLLVITTPNRTPLSYLIMIVFAEYILRLLPIVSHSKIAHPISFYSGNSLILQICDSLRTVRYSRKTWIQTS